MQFDFIEIKKLCTYLIIFYPLDYDIAWWTLSGMLFGGSICVAVGVAVYVSRRARERGQQPEQPEELEMGTVSPTPSPSPSPTPTPQPSPQQSQASGPSGATPGSVTPSLSRSVSFCKVH